MGKEYKTEIKMIKIMISQTNEREIMVGKSLNERQLAGILVFNTREDDCVLRTHGLFHGGVLTLGALVTVGFDGSAQLWLEVERLGEAALDDGRDLRPL